jgi:DNA polymerase elongation subunit (family B)
MKILALDIETTPNLVYTWGLRDQNIALNQIVEPARVMCWGAKWLDLDGPRKKDTIFRAEWEHPFYIEEAHELLDEADVVVHWNGTSFDIPHLQREFHLAALGPTSPFVELDLIKTVRRRFRFQSNKLEHVAQQLLGEGKVQNGGMQLWRDIIEPGTSIDRRVKAQRTMRKYNIQDVELLDRLYHELRPWIPNHPNVSNYLQDPEVCPRCGAPADSLVRRGVRRTATGTFLQYRCSTCGGYSRSRTAHKETVVRPERVVA